MKDDRLRVTLDDAYAHALGVAAFCWARCEWDAVWCCERLETGFINTIEPKRMTAGQIASKLLVLVSAITDQNLKSICQGPAAEFKRLVDERNGLLHGKPGSAINGDQRLFRHGAEWSIAEVNTLADAATACQILLNDMVHKHLK